MNIEEIDKLIILNIYGDNILECEEALRLIIDSINGQRIYIDGPLYNPSYVISINKSRCYLAKLFPGYDRWKFDVKNVMNSLGAKLRESTDAIVTKMENVKGEIKEVPILAMEFCGALPAGNNAWQRSGRAISCAQSRIPYLYFTELGGLELDSNRNIKASRFPNPIIPFAYLILSKTYQSDTLPIYLPSPSITNELKIKFNDYFSVNDAKVYIKSIIEGSSNIESKDLVVKKAFNLTKYLALKRKDAERNLSSNEWEKVFNLNNSKDITNWIINKNMTWKKKISIPTTKTFMSLLSSIHKLNVSAVYSSDMPFCLLSYEQKKQLLSIIKDIYKDNLSSEFINWLDKDNNPLYIVWIAGFKPKGDDSRPDRGLVPLLRMIVGGDVQILTIVYGPCPKLMIEKLQQNMWEMSSQNGLWQSILNFSNAVIVDGNVEVDVKPIGIRIKEKSPLLLQSQTLKIIEINKPHKFGEHDVDTVIHQVFNIINDENCFEGLCNPPGGNWSGISLYNFEKGIESRWVSLPRVSGKEAKRPDHLFQIKTDDGDIFTLLIESKETVKSIEDNIGNRLKKYLIDLLTIKPNIVRLKKKEWEQNYTEEYSKPQTKLFSAVAFRLDSLTDLYSIRTRSNVDSIIGIEFLKDESVCFHLLLNKESGWLGNFFKERSKITNGWLKIQIH